MPPVNMNMDVRKWSWPGVLTFGRNQRKKLPELPKDEEGLERKGEESPKEAGDIEDTQAVSVKVDTSSLEDAMTSDARSVPAASVATSALAETDTNMIPTPDSDTAGDPEATTEGHIYPASQPDIALPSSNAISSYLKDETSPPSQTSLSAPRPEFSSTMVHLPLGDNLLLTKWRKVLYLRNHDMVVALIEGPSGNNRVHDLSLVANRCIRLLEDIHTAAEAESETTSASLPSATKILQPKDRHMISSDHFTDSSPGFAPKSEQFYNGKQLLDKDSDISEVFSRGQNPQHWHVARRGLGVDDHGNEVNGEVFLEISRKEASLTDVDNVLVSVVKRFN